MGPDLRNMTVGQRWRFRRNLAIAHLARDGWSQRMLADVFDVSRTQVASVVREVRARADSVRETDRCENGPGPGHGHRLPRQWIGKSDRRGSDRVAGAGVVPPTRTGGRDGA